MAVDTARWYVEMEKQQKAADAAALAGVPYIPQDFATALSNAKRIAANNGYDPTTNTKIVVQVCALSDAYSSSGVVSAGCQTGLRPSQLRVIITSDIPNFFATIFGFNRQGLTRQAVSDFNGPAPIGSPCNTLGNEPPSTTQSGQLPTGSALPGNTAPATCVSAPEFWGNIHGPEVAKVQGDQYMTRHCNGGEANCSGTTNLDFNASGYFLTVNVGAAAVGQKISLQLYDPASVDTGGQCAGAPTGTIGANNQYPLAPNDANVRYASAAGTYCTGDQDYGGTVVNTVTSFGLRDPVDDANPLDAAPTKSTSGGSCAKQYYGWNAPTYTALKANTGVTKVFHQWTSLCDFIPTQEGSYYLQIRTNVSCQTQLADGTCTNPDRVYTQSGDDNNVKGNTANRYAVRAVTSANTAVSVSGLTKMAIYANAPGKTAEFNLIQVIPAAAGKNIVFKFFDPGDGETNGTIRIVPPTDATIVVGASKVPYTTLTGCTGQDRAAGFTTPACVVNPIGGNVNPTWQGQIGTVILPIPDTYSCTTSNAYGCWFRVNVNYPSNGVTDATTWTAYITGDPVRLTQ